MLKSLKRFLVSAAAAGILIWGSGGSYVESTVVYAAADLAEIPSYTGNPYTVLNDNVPEFSQEEFTEESFESYSELDALGRCGVAYANIGPDLMPQKEREKIGQVRPSGWQTVKYDFVDGKYLYNRCHLIGYQLTAENANKQNLITGTRYMNVDGMLPFENMTADYIHETGNHVLYRVTPLYQGDDLVASGVQMEARSVEDEGEGILFNVYCYNVQPGVKIDYRTGDSWEDSEYVTEEAEALSDGGNMANQSEGNAISQAAYVVNINTEIFHKPECSSVKRMKEKNKLEYTDSRDELISQGYTPCKNCNP